MLRYPWGLETAHHQKQLSYDNVIAGKKRAAFCLHRPVCGVGCLRCFPHFWEFVRFLWGLIRFCWVLVGGVGQILGIS